MKNRIHGTTSSGSLGRTLGHVVMILGSIGAFAVGFALLADDNIYPAVAVGVGIGVLIQVMVVAAVLLMLADVADATGYLARDRDEEWANADEREPAALATWPDASGSR